MLTLFHPTLFYYCFFCSVNSLAGGSVLNTHISFMLYVLGHL
uniref:Uncharacterized protein n=1 Tax=Anguilla anguilla TaxID=7936 RepID=A0A0E9TQK4_ANGAN